MASEFMSLNDKDTKDLRKQLGLPTTKDLRYFYRENVSWVETKVINYEIVDTYQPSGTHSMLITLADNTQVRILADYFADMQKTTFLSDISEKNENIVLKKEMGQKEIVGTKGKRIDDTPNAYIVLDLETTGFSHTIDEIIEIGAIKYQNGIEVDRYATLIKTDKTISKAVREKTGITNDLLEKEGIDKKIAIQSVYEFIGNDVIVGHNIASFDSYFMDDAFQDVLNCRFSNDYVDTLFLAKKKYPKLKHHNLDALSEEFNIDYSRAHRAIADCIINHLVYDNLVYGNVLHEEMYREYLLDTIQDQTNVDDLEIDEIVEIEATQYVGWKKSLSDVLCKLIVDLNLPPKSLDIKANYNRNKDEVTSYSICIYEPDLIEDKRSADRYSVVSRISEKVDMLSVEPKNQDELINLELPEDAKLYSPNKAPAYFRINQTSENLIPYFEKSVKYALDNYSSKAGSFSCCARYEECSNEKKCIHPNQLYSTACAYRKNLESGKIFYGKNKI